MIWLVCQNVYLIWLVCCIFIPVHQSFRAPYWSVPSCRICLGYYNNLAQPQPTVECKAMKCQKPAKQVSEQPGVSITYRRMTPSRHWSPHGCLFHSLRGKKMSSSIIATSQSGKINWTRTCTTNTKHYQHVHPVKRTVKHALHKYM